MSRRDQAAEGRECYAPADRNLVEALHNAADTIVYFTDHHIDGLGFADHMCLAETLVRIRAYAEILESFSDGFVRKAIQEVDNKVRRLGKELRQQATEGRL